MPSSSFPDGYCDPNFVLQGSRHTYLRGHHVNYLESHLKVVGTRPVRPDGVDKVTGRALFAADTRAAGMLWGKIKRSPHAHARIVAIDTSKAQALPGVMAVLTAADMPNIPSEEAF